MSNHESALLALTVIGLVYLISHGYVQALRTVIEVHTNFNNPQVQFFGSQQSAQSALPGIVGQAIPGASIQQQSGSAIPSTQNA